MTSAVTKHPKRVATSEASDLRAWSDSVRACHALATTHYENFHVLSCLLPREFEGDFASLYAFCRCADDAADERSSAEESRLELDALSCTLDGIYERNVETNDAIDWPFAPYIPAWAHLIRKHDLPREPFDALLWAFRQDQIKTRYETMEKMLEYCTGSANPVGRLVLLITGHASHPNLASMFAASDATCTALQLTNFWQDVARDLRERNRIYIPMDWMAKYDLSETDLADMVNDRQADERFRHLERALVDYTQPLFDQGRALWDQVDSRVRPTIRLFTLGGESILKAIADNEYDVLARRPRLSKARRFMLLASAWIEAHGLFARWYRRRKRTASFENSCSLQRIE